LKRGGIIKSYRKLKQEAEKYGKISKAYMDAGYDDKKVYIMFLKGGAQPIIKPRKTVDLERVKELIRERKDKLKHEVLKQRREEIISSILRLENLREYLENGKEWKKKRDWGKRWVVESRYSVFKRKFDEHVFSKKLGNICREVAIKLTLMNLFTYTIKEDIQKIKESS
jgi:hypothetical protein